MNPNLDGFANVVNVGNAVAALAAVAVNLWAVKTGPPAMARMWASVAALAAVYVAAYTVLVFSDLTPQVWSSYMRGVSLIAWPLVWVQSAVTTRQWLRFRRGIEEAGDEL